jgi:hypothetical protein
LSVVLSYYCHRAEVQLQFNIYIYIYIYIYISLHGGYSALLVLIALTATKFRRRNLLLSHSSKHVFVCHKIFLSNACASFNISPYLLLPGSSSISSACGIGPHGILNTFQRFGCQKSFKSH